MIFKHASQIIMLIFILTTYPLSAYSQVLQISKSNFNQEMKNLGIESKLSNNTLKIMINHEKSISMVSELEKNGILDTTDKSILKSSPITFQFENINQLYVASLIKYYFDNDKINKLHVEVYISAPDNDKKVHDNFCASFDIDRETYDLINWKSLKYVNLYKAMNNYKLEDWCINKLIEEHDKYMNQ